MVAILYALNDFMTWPFFMARDDEIQLASSSNTALNAGIGVAKGYGFGYGRELFGKHILIMGTLLIFCVGLNIYLISKDIGKKSSQQRLTKKSS